MEKRELLERQRKTEMITQGEYDYAIRHMEEDKRGQLCEAVINAFGSPHFDPDYLHQEIYSKCDTTNGSTLALLNSLREITELAKACYTDTPKI